MLRVTCIVLAVLASWLVPALALAAPLHVELVTVGPGSDDLSLYGHSALCVTADGDKDGICYDFGVPDGSGDAGQLAWDTLRGRPRFVPIGVYRAELVATFEDLERDIWVQDLPLDDAQAAALHDALEADVTAPHPYWYHPYYDNCTTRLRDALDAATSGKLHAGADVPSAGPTFRGLSEKGFSGHLFELAGLALFLGTGTDKQPTEWQRMFLPVALRDAVEARLGAAPKRIYEHRGAEIATSTAAGRAGLVFLGAILAGVLVYCARKGPRWLRASLGGVGVLWGLLGVAVDVVPLLSRFPELGHSWVVLVLWPTDVVLGFLPPRWLARYLVVRLGVLALLLLLSAAGVIAQPLVGVCIFAGLPLGVAYLVVRFPGFVERSRATPRTAPASWGT